MFAILRTAAAVLALSGGVAWATEATEAARTDPAAADAVPAAAESLETPVKCEVCPSTPEPLAAAPASEDEPALALGTAVGAQTLDAHRGGAEQNISEMRVRGTLQENAAYNLETGSNLITDGAFANTVGLPMTIQNSGNNVLIQNSTIIQITDR